MKLRSTLVFVLAALMVAIPVQPMFAQPANQTTTVALTYAMGESLTISATPSTLTIPSNGSLSSLVSVTTSWNLQGGTGEGTIELDAWLGSATAALSGAGGNIPSSAIFATEASTLAGGTAGSNACTLTKGQSTGAACPAIYVQPTSGFALNSSNTSTIALALPNPTGIAAGTYTGTLTLFVQVY